MNNKDEVTKTSYDELVKQIDNLNYKVNLLIDEATRPSRDKLIKQIDNLNYKVSLLMEENEMLKNVLIDEKKIKGWLNDK